MIKRHYIISYLKVGYHLHLISLVEIFGIFYFLMQPGVEKWLAERPIFWRSILLLSIIIIPSWPQLDARSRFQNYKQVKDHLYSKGFQPRLLKPFAKSSCQRSAVLIAAEELGMGKKCKAYFYSLGYRWYHFFPDFVFTQPQYLTTPAFWSNTFFAKTYRPLFDFYGKEGKREKELKRGVDNNKSWLPLQSKQGI